jgi:hypothetical protein
MREYIPFVDPRLRIGWCETMGHGVFASRPISRGEYVEIAPVVVLDTMPQDQIASRYVVAWGDRFAIPLGWTMLYNHSDANRCEYSANIRDGLFGIVAVADINAGEQVTVNYGPHWFSSRGMEKVLI